MSNTALQALRALKNRRAIKEDVDLLEYMFSFAVKDGKVQQSKYLDRVMSVYEQVLDFDKNEDGKPLAIQPGQPPNDDVVFFCDYTRYVENEDCFGNPQDGLACDTALAVEVTMDSTWHSCKIASSDGGNPYAFTVNNFGKPASSIQLCQWMLEDYYYAEYVFWDEAAKNGRLAWAHSRLFPAMDLASVYDKKALHEMTHAIFEHETYDVDGDHSYNWDNCESISANSKDLNNLADNSMASYRNADNYALYALGASLILPPRRFNVPQHRIHRDGDVTIFGSSSQSQQKRSPEGGDKFLENAQSLNTTDEEFPSSIFRRGPTATESKGRHTPIGDPFSEERFERQQSILAQLAKPPPK